MMRIIGWNCNMAFKNKAEIILRFNPDILVVSECEKIGEQTSNFLWFGDNINKGLGIFSYFNYTIELHELYNDQFKYVVPIKVKGPFNFNLFAVWTKQVDDKSKEYVGQLNLALDYYEKILNEPTIIIGDFNMDKKIEIKYKYKDPARITSLWTFLKKKNIESTYHQYFDEELGGETKPTLFQWRKLAKPFHNDYCFASNNFIDKLSEVFVGEYVNWKIYSDHMPIIVTFKDN